MSKVTVIIGEPATGKSTIMKNLIINHGPWKYDPTIKYIPCHWQTPDKCIIGRYDDMDHQFPGTDRMSMACQQYAINFISDHSNTNFILEGDRLGNKMFLWALRDMGIDLWVLRIWLRPELLSVRRQERDQSEKFLKSRTTKINNLLNFCGQANIPLSSIENLDTNTSNIIAKDLYENRL